MRKWLVVLVLLFTAAFWLAGCSGPQEVAQVAGKNYLYEGEGFGSNFVISFYEDGTFSYYEGMLSSYIGIGSWKQHGSIVEMTDDGFGGDNRVNYFTVDGGELIFKEEGSDNFLYLKIADGGKFCETTEEPDVTLRP